jgi:hypothetical protein
MVTRRNTAMGKFKVAHYLAVRGLVRVPGHSWEEWEPARNFTGRKCWYCVDYD